MAIGWSEKSSSGFSRSNWSQAREAPAWAGLPWGRRDEPWGTEHLSSHMDIRELGETGCRRQREEGEEKRVLRR